MKETSFDLAVIGGGPAGTSAAISAARMGASVVLLDSSDFPRQKVCGEFVSAESLELLRDLVRDHPTADEQLRNAPVITRARIFAAGRTAETSIEPPGLSIPRTALDLLLWECAEQSGVSARRKCEVLSISGQGPFTLTTAAGDVSANAILLCTGRWSRFSDSGEAVAGPKWIGIKAHYRERDSAQATDLYFFDRGYCGVQPVSHDAVNVCALVRSDCASTLEAVFRRSRQLRARAEQWERITSPVSTAPVLYRKPICRRDNLLLAGDAAGFIDPFAGDGISLALRTGKAAADCLESFFHGQNSIETAALSYETRYNREFAPLIAASTRVRSLLSLPEIARPLALQVLRLPGVLPYMVRKTRGE